MRWPIVQGVGILGLLCGLVRGETFGQTVGTGIPAPNRSPAAAPGYYMPPGYPPTLATPNDSMPPGYPPSRVTNPGGMAPTTRLTGYQPGASEPPSPTGSPGPANETDVALPRAERPGGGGEPTTAAEEGIKKEEAKEEGEGKEEEKKEEEEKEEEAPAKDETKLLMNVLGHGRLPRQDLRLDPEQLHRQHQRHAQERPELRRQPELPGQPLDGQPVLPDHREPARAERQDQLRLPRRQPVRQRLAVQPHARADRALVPAQPLRRLRPRPDLRRGPPARS